MPWNTTAANPDRYFMRNRMDDTSEEWYGSNVGRTTGVWNQSRNNPEMIGGCPIDIALITDTSGSLRANDDLPKLQNAMSAFVDAFRGTTTRMSVFSFSTTSPGNSASNHPDLMPVTTAAQAAAFKDLYADWGDGGGTNWDAAFAEAANAAPQYDLAVLLTDGNPTVIPGFTDGSSAFNSFQDVDGGIFSANQLKAQGTKVISVGIGTALTTASEYNLRAVSGTVKGQDYFRAANFDEATEVLLSLAQERCSGSIGVQKLIVPEGGTIADAAPAPAGWEFGAAVPAGGATIDPTSATTVDGGDGKVEFGLSYDPGTAIAGIEIHEVQQDGYDLFPVDGKNAVCVNVNTGADVNVTNAGDAAMPAFGLNAQENERVECRIYNQPRSAGQLEVAKSSDPASGTEVSPGQEVSYTLTFANTGGMPAAVDYEDVLTGVLDDAELLVGPTAQSPLVANYDAASNRIIITGTLPAGDSKTVTYTVKVKSELPDDADGVLGNFVVKSGDTPPTECLPEDPLCTEHPVVGSLSWDKVDSADTATLLSGSKWTLTPYGAAGELNPDEMITVEDCVADSAADCTGADTEPAAGKFLIQQLVPGAYSLAEIEAPAGYQLLDAPIDVVVNSNYAFGDIKNVQSEVPQLPLTGGMGTLAIFLGAGGIGALVVLALILQRRRMRLSVGS
ncbi:MAG: SpaA isopeptide-forming pilin-related protein [Leucobacter sp.]